MALSCFGIILEKLNNLKSYRIKGYSESSLVDIVRNAFHFRPPLLLFALSGGHLRP